MSLSIELYIVVLFLEISPHEFDLSRYAVASISHSVLGRLE